MTWLHLCCVSFWQILCVEFNLSLDIGLFWSLYYDTCFKFPLAPSISMHSPKLLSIPFFHLSSSLMFLLSYWKYVMQWVVQPFSILKAMFELKIKSFELSHLHLLITFSSKFTTIPHFLMHKIYFNVPSKCQKKHELYQDL